MKTWTFPSIFIVALAVVGALFLLGYPLELENSNFWNNHGVFFLIFITIFPRLTLLFSSVPFGGLFWWIGFFFAPRLLVAILATLNYWQQNPVLVIIAWIVALSGETGEKTVVTRKYRRRENLFSKDAIEAEYKVKK